MNIPLDRQTHLLARIANQPRRVAASSKGKQSQNCYEDDCAVLDGTDHENADRENTAFAQGHDDSRQSLDLKEHAPKMTKNRAMANSALIADGSNFLSKKHGDAASSLHQLLNDEENQKPDRRGMIIDLLA